MNEEEIRKIIEKSRKKIAISQLKKEEIKMPKRNILKMVATFVLCIGVTFSIVYAGFQLENLFKIKWINDKGIQTAIENQYIQNIDMEYIEKEKVKFKVDYLMMDDINFDLVFNFITTDKVENYEAISLGGIQITDEKNNQIYIASEEQNIWTKNIAITSELWSIVEKHDNIVRQVIHLSSNNFPKSNKIIVNFDNVILYNVNQGNPITIEYKDNYHLEFDISKQLTDRKTIEYQVVDTTQQVKNIKLTNSGLSLTIKEEQYITQEDNYTITDENGVVYQLANTSPIFEIEKLDNTLNEQLLIFDMTIYNQTNKLRLNLPDGETIELIQEQN